MYTDLSGCSPTWWQSLLLSMFVPGYTIGAIIGGIIFELNGGNFSAGAETGGITGSIISIMGITALLSSGATVGLTTAFGGGLWAAVGAGALVGGISGAIMGGGFNLLQQGLMVGYGNVNWCSVGKTALIGGLTGAVFGGLTGAMNHAAEAGLKIAKKAFSKAAKVLSETHMYSGGSKIASYTAWNAYNIAEKSLRIAQNILNAIRWQELL